VTSVVLIVFDGPQQYIALAESRVPQVAGTLYPPGGEVAESEGMSVAAAQRIFLEKAGVDITMERWHRVGQLRRLNGDGVVFLTTTRNCNLKVPEGGERITWYNLAGISRFDMPCDPSLHYIVPLALDPRSPLATFEERP
jgi:hypothetical protein